MAADRSHARHDDQQRGATNNSQRTLGLWDDFHIDNTNTSGYGENHGLAVMGVRVGANNQASSDQQGINLPTSRYGLYIADGQAGSVGDATINAAGTGYSVGDQLTCARRNQLGDMRLHRGDSARRRHLHA